MDWTKIVSLALSTGIFAFVIWLVRERRLREKYALLWLSTSLFIILLTVSRRILEVAALSIGIFYPPSLLFLVGVLFLLMVSIGHSVTLSRLSESNHNLAQEVALLRKQLEDETAKREQGCKPAP
ncbi:MAG: hypothetical protein A2075_22055 [Geobacteraceae bacterium GWC2_58_44]|nr:MAG: hypothetical protein A2075_22055 [Geobacteraceae bacterium GWC2_58_44]HBG07047.1 DUF2304 domain-containing protein [Geobacter sp.]